MNAKTVDQRQALIASITQSLKVLTRPGQVFEVRIPKVGGRKRVDGGYFDDTDTAAQAITKYDGRAGGIYIALNPVNPALLSRYANRIAEYAEPLSGDGDILRRQWFPLDVDAKRPADISSTDAEHAAALAKTREIVAWLSDELGWPQPVLGDSGNGGHALYAVDLPNTPETAHLIEHCVQALARKFDDTQLKVDTGVFNASRVWKVYGTRVCKGDNTPDRPHRRAKLLEVPETPCIVTLEQLKALEALLPSSAPAARPATRSDSSQKLDVGKWLTDHNIAAKRVPYKAKDGQEGEKWLLDACPFSDAHKDGAVVIQFANGAVSAMCQHNSCKGKGWKELRAKYEPLPRLYTNGNGAGNSPVPNGTPAQPPIQVNNRQFIDLFHTTLAAIRTANAAQPTTPLIYVYNGVLARILPEEYTIVPYDADSLRTMLAGIAQWVTVKQRKDGDEVTDARPPLDLVRSLLAEGYWPGVPRLDGVVRTPILGLDGQIHATAGYDAATHLYYVPDGLTLGDTTPSETRRQWAKDLITDGLLGEFPFRDAASRAHALALFLLPFVRPGIDGATPLHLADAPSIGTGKGLLIDVCTLAATGMEAAGTTATADPEELRKHLTALLLKNASHIHFDNVTVPLSAGVLAMMLTQPVIDDRILGSSTAVRLRVTQIWTATGNNVQLSAEIARRTIHIRLDADSEKPWLRTGFKHPDLRAWTKAHRSELITAGLVLIRAWQEAGRPAGNYIKGSFDAWAATMGGILDVAGVEGFLGNEQELFDAASSENERWAAFVAEWAQQFGEAPTPTSDLFVLASHADEVKLNGPTYLELLDDLLGAGKEHGRLIKLGNLLRQHTDMVIGGYKIAKAPTVHGKPQWRLRKLVESAPLVESPQQDSTSQNTPATGENDPPVGELVESGRVFTTSPTTEKKEPEDPPNIVDGAAVEKTLPDSTNSTRTPVELVESSPQDSTKPAMTDAEWAVVLNSLGKLPLPQFLWRDDFTTRAEAFGYKYEMDNDYLTMCGLDRATGHYYVRAPGQ